MMVRRKEVMPPTPPVKFYKTIALSFLFLTIILLGVVILITAKKATITVEATQNTKTINFIAKTQSASSTPDTLMAQVTTTAFTWSKKYFPTATKTLDAVATGEVTIYNKGNTAQPLVKTTQLLSAGGVLFRLENGVVVPAQGQVAATVYADQAGATGNIAPSTFTVVKLNADKQKVIYAESKQDMTGGVKKIGFLSTDDLTNAQADMKNQTQEQYTAKNPTNGQTQVVSVIDQTFKSDGQVGEEAADFTLTTTATVLMVSYNSADLKVFLDREVGKNMDQRSEKILSLDNAPSVKVLTYDLKNGSTELSVSENMVVTLDANAESLTPNQFVGKSKEEIERYTQSLDHVAKTEVKLFPSWISTAPSAAGKIQVIVKNVQ